MKKLYCFDFDGTLTDRDSFIKFVHYAHGTLKFITGMFLYSPLIVLMKLHLMPSGKVKQRIFSHFFKGMSIDRFNSICSEFAGEFRHHLIESGMKALYKATNENADILIVSASIENWIRPCIKTPGVHILATKIEVNNGYITGKFDGNNCSRAEKVKRINNLLSEPRENYYIIAFGDSRGDKEMLDFADESYYKPFHKK